MGCGSNNLTAWNNGDGLVKAVAGANANTVVVVHSVGPLILEPWVDHPNVTAVRVSPSSILRNNELDICVVDPMGWSARPRIRKLAR